MNLYKYKATFFILIILFNFLSCKQKTQFEGQGKIKEVSTQTLPIQLQHKGIFTLGDGMFMSNDYSGARLNGVVRINDSLISVLITPENSPINKSPWYGFKIWSEAEKNIFVKLNYNENAFHRYYPKISKNGSHWEALDSTKFQIITKFLNEKVITESLTMQILVNKDTLWISAQELITSSTVEIWTTKLLHNSFVTKSKIGESIQGRPINLFKIGENDDKKMMIAISRQHPPEVTGFLAMQTFVETICSDSELARRFRAEYNTYIIPLVNPDGVDNGHWRHNYGGVDLNRDWKDFNQLETSAIKDFMKQKVNQTGGKFYFGIDFHSTWEDIFYTIDPKFNGNMPGLVPKLIDEIGNEFPDYEPNIKPRIEDARVTSLDFFFHEFGAEALIYEVGDNTNRDFIRKKGEITAMKLMELMLK